jgi:hypothetical protein
MTKDSPVSGSDFPFYYVEPRKHCETLPWLGDVAKLLEIKHEEVNCGY